MHTEHIATAIAPRFDRADRRGRPAEQRADAVVAAAPKVGSASPGTCQVTRTKPVAFADDSRRSRAVF